MDRPFWTSLLISMSFCCVTAEDTTPLNWPKFRGGESDGLAKGSTLPDRWSETENVVWKQDIPGFGWSSPIVWEDKIFVTSAIGPKELPTPHIGGYPGGHLQDEGIHRWVLFCLDFETGKIRWQGEAYRGLTKEKRHPRNSYASETPCTDGERVYALFMNHGLFCFSMTGEKLWERTYEAYPMRDGWNSGASPIVHGDRVFVQNDNLENSFIEALDTKTGEVLWHVKRDEPSTWATPYLWENQLRNELVTIGTNRIRSYDPESGEQLWELRGTSGLVSQMPMSKNGLLYVGAGYHYGPLYAIRPGASGDISLEGNETSNEWIEWYQRRGSSIHPSYLISEDRLFVCYDSGLIACFHARTGEVIFSRKRLDTRGGRFYSSPWAYNGKLFLLNENGDTWVLEDGPEFKMLYKNSLGDVAWATPAIARGNLFVRTYRSVFRLQDQSQTVP